MNKMIEAIKEVHSTSVCMFKIGNFYHTYNRDSYIMAYLFKYKIKELGFNHKECGFPIMPLPKIIAKLESSNINYLVIDRRNNYDVDEKEDYKNLNQYNKYYEKASKYINYKKRINNITEYLNKNIETNDFAELLFEMEEKISERGKI